MKKRLVAGLLLSIGLISGLTSFAAPSPWAEQAVLWLKYSETIPLSMFNAGTEQNAITREQFSELAVRLYAQAKGESVDQIGYTLPFGDTQNPMIGRAYHLGIVKGLTADKFGPQEKITREQLATMLYREIKLLGMPAAYTQGDLFSDHSALSSYAVDAVYFCKSNSLVNGVGQNKFAPKSNTTIEQAQLIVFNILKKYNWSSPVTYTLDKTYGLFKIPTKTDLSISSDPGKKITLRFVLPVKGSADGWTEEKSQWEAYGILRSHKSVPYLIAEQVLMQSHSLWDTTLQQYMDTPLMYVGAGGAVTSVKPAQGAFVTIESKGTLQLTLFIP